MAEQHSDQLDLLILADLHYVGKADHTCPIPERNAWLGKELAERAVRRALREARPDAIILMGDLVDDGLAEGADDDLAAIAKCLRQFEIPILVVPGNHDGPADRLLALFGDHTGIHELNGYQLITIATAYDECDVTRHAQADLALVAQAAAAAPGKPTVVLQHNPVYPPIESSYPFNPANAEEIKRCYSAAGVLASISGHYHPGLPPEEAEGVCYVAAPALCEEPFGCLRVRLRGRSVEASEESLKMAARPPLWDIHCHTHYAYCGDGIEAKGAIQRSSLFGLRGIVLAEHAGQLYVSPEDFWHARFFHDPDLIRRSRRTPACRMDAYLATVLPLRSHFVRLGLEVDSDGRGGITLLDEDKAHWDVLIGAVHWVPFFDPATATEAERARRFMDATESVLRAGVDVLAHPFRYFRRHQVSRPKELYRPLARLLAETGVAAEINFHTNEPDPAFFAICLEEGVKIALGTDSHALWEVGELGPHLDVLRRAGCTEDNLGRVLFTP